MEQRKEGRESLDVSLQARDQSKRVSLKEASIWSLELSKSSKVLRFCSFLWNYYIQAYYWYPLFATCRFWWGGFWKVTSICIWKSALTLIFLTHTHVYVLLLLYCHGRWHVKYYMKFCSIWLTYLFFFYILICKLYKYI